MKVLRPFSTQNTSFLGSSLQPISWLSTE